MAQFNRQTDQAPPGGATSFKTNVNRNKTKKWTEAKSNNYDGDDWGGFDPYDEYGSYDEPTNVVPTSSGGGSRPPGGPGPQRPQGQPNFMRPDMRQNSFERGEERRAFSGPAQGGYPRGYPPPQPPYGDRSRGTSQDSRSPSERGGGRREFSQPTHVPQPLHMRPSHSPHERGSGRPPIVQRTSDQAPQDQLPLTEHGSSVAGAKPAPAIPFIRPSDIYKRMQQEQERERQSLDSSRPSIDVSPNRKEVAAPVDGGTAPVRTSTDVSTPGTDLPKPQTDLTIPAITQNKTASAVSGSPALISRDSTQAEIAGFQSLVDQAFDRPEADSPSLSSTTPASQGRVADLSRSNTESTSGISPIMSRVPSAATAEARGRAAQAYAGPVPPIIEEASSPVAARPHQLDVAEAPSQIDQRRRSSGPSPHASPARSPKVEQNDKESARPRTAELAKEEEIKALPLLGAPSHNSFLQENRNHVGPLELRTTETTASVAGVPTKQSPTITSPIASPLTGRTSPFPGRVKDLAGKYNDIHDESRRNSQTSTTSKYSTSTWARTNTGDSVAQSLGKDAVAAESPTEDNIRPAILTQPSFRPHLPGEWVSTTNVLSRVESPVQLPTEVSNQEDEPELTNKNLSDQDPDFTPSVHKTNPSHDQGIVESAIDAVKAAGNALGASLLSTGDATHSTRDFASTADASNDPTADVTPKRTNSIAVGDVYLRPLELNRAASSIASSGAPTPPAKDTPKDLNESNKSCFGSSAAERESSDNSLEDDSNDALESDRLRKEIVRSLTPSTDDRPGDLPGHARNTSDATAHRLSVPAQHSPLRSEHKADDPRDLSSNTEAPNLLLGNGGGGPGLLSQRFSFENRSLDLLGSTGLDGPSESSKPDLRVTTEPSRSSVQPSSDISLESERENAHGVVQDVSPVTVGHDRPSIDSRRQPSPVGSKHLTTTDAGTSEELGPVGSTHLGRASNDLPDLPAEAATPSAANTAAAGTRIPPFRQMLAIKSTPERIQTYNTARKQFAEMDTGLRNWLGATLAARPEHDVGSLNSPFPHAPNSSTSPAQARQTSSSFPTGSPQGGTNVEKVSAKGKDLFISAGKLGGKGVVGAKGWLAKSKQKLRESGGGGSEKVD